MAGAERDPDGATVIEPSTAPEIARLGLLAELDAELHLRYPGEPTNGIETQGFEDAGGCFVLARRGAAAVGCGAFRPADARTVELKRMYVREAHRGHGIAGRLLTALEREALKRGFTHAVLETGTRQPEAIALYRRHGYQPIAKFGEYVDLAFSVCFGKALVREVTAPATPR